MNLSEIRTAYERQRGQQQALLSQREAAEQRFNHHSEQAKEYEEARDIVQIIAQQTQDQLRYRIEEPVSLAMSAVFDTPYRLAMEFVPRRGRTECDLFFEKGKVRGSDLEFLGGGGALDVAAFALQISIITLTRNYSNPVLILDEPLKWLKGGDLPRRGALMISEISRELGVQVIMVSHIPEQVAGADRVIEVRLEGESSTVSIGGE